MKNKILKKTAAFLALVMTLSLSTAVFAETATNGSFILFPAI